MPINTEVCRQVHDQILLEPETHYQDHWFEFNMTNKPTPEDCGSTACVAGHAAIKAGLVEYNNDAQYLGYFAWSAVPKDNLTWAEAGIKALGLEDYVQDGSRVVLPVEGEFTATSYDDCHCEDDPECNGGCAAEPGIDLFHGDTERDQVLHGLAWLIKEGERQDALREAQLELDLDAEAVGGA